MRVRRAFWVSAVAMVVLACELCASCNRQPAAWDRVDAQCAAHCAWVGVASIRSQLGVEVEGIDPSAGNGPAARYLDAALCDLAEDAAGLTVQPFGDFFSELESGRSVPTALLIRGRHVYLFLGSWMKDGLTFYQLLHGESQPLLVRHHQLVELGFSRAVFVREPQSEGVRLRAGSVLLGVNELVHNLGLVPGDVKDVRFELRNLGEGTIVLGEPKASCGCMAVKYDGPRELKPGGAVGLHVELSPFRGGDGPRPENTSANSDAIAHSILVPLVRPDKEEPDGLVLRVTGSYYRPLDVVPRSLDFGPLRQGEKALRTIRLSETTVDRFAIQKIDVGDLPVTTRLVPQERAPTARASYLVEVELCPESRPAGHHQGAIVIATDSPAQPQIVVPVHYRVVSRARLVPSLVDFRTATAGERATQTVRLVGDGTTSVSFVRARPAKEGDVLVKPTDQPDVLAVEAVFATGGVWRRCVALELKIGSSEELLNLDCVAFVRPHAVTSPSGASGEGRVP